MKPAFYFALATHLLFVFASPGYGTFIDLRGLDSNAPLSRSITVDGITLNLQVFSGSGTLPSTPTRFGIDSTGDQDVPDLLDGGNGFAEELGFLFGPSTAVLDSIVISNFDDDDAGEIIIKGVPPIPISVTNGVISLTGFAASPSSANSIRWTGENLPGGTRGFSIDGFNFHLTPEPASFWLGLGFVAVLFCWRRQRIG